MPENEAFEIIADFDDTLVPTVYLYQVANWDCGRLISEAIAPNGMQSQEILKISNDLDLEHAKQYGFNPRRFQLSWVKTYVECANRAGKPVDRATVRKVWWAAAKFKHGPFTPFPGVVPTLIKLRHDGHKLHLLTSGPEKLQRRKIRQSLVGHSFHSTTIVAMDKRPEMERLKRAAEAAGRRIVMVGDSKRSDIAPAVELGITAVWIPGIKWEFAQADVEHDTFHTLQSFVQLPRFLRELPPR